MKTITSLAATVGIVITISSCGLGKIRQGVNKIERGMTKEQVTSLLGAPLNRSIQADQSELWEYSFSDFPGNTITAHVSTPTQGTILDEAIATPTEKMLVPLRYSITMYKS